MILIAPEFVSIQWNLNDQEKRVWAGKVLGGLGSSKRQIAENLMKLQGKVIFTLLNGTKWRLKRTKPLRDRVVLKGASNILVWRSSANTTSCCRQSDVRDQGQVRKEKRAHSRKTAARRLECISLTVHCLLNTKDINSFN